jgi:Fur family transcriptional regulator, ferric uptake regulator
MAQSNAWIDHATSALGAAGYRGGAARAAVIDYLATQTCCRTALEIYEAVRSRHREVGLASVYRALDTLTQLRLIQRVDVGDGIARFEPAAPTGEHHHHLVCDDCGKVEPFADPTLESAIERVADGRGYVVAAHDVVLHGACEDCRHDDAHDDRSAAA